MEIYQMRENLRAVIDSEEKFKAAVSDSYRSTLTHRVLDAAGNMNGHHAPWWANRENARCLLDVYKSTTVLEYIRNQLPHTFVHISEDPEFVAYTPDAAAGERDKQIKTTLGRFLSKHFPLYRDEHIQSLVSEHYAELNLVVEFANTQELIREAYDRGPTSCMDGAHTFGYLPAGVRPIDAYVGVEGLEIAVIRDKSGRINARALVRRDVKQFIRVYGDEKLRRYLLSQGYTPGTFGGLKFNKIAVDRVTRDSTPGYLGFVMPYLDANGGRGEAGSCQVGLVDGELRVLTQDEYKIVKHLGVDGTASGVTTSGYIAVKPITLQDMQLFDHVTNQPIASLDEVNIVYALLDGEYKLTTSASLAAHLPNYVEAKDSAFRKSGESYAPREMCFAHKVRSYSSSEMFIVESEQNRIDFGYFRLDTRFYPEAVWMDSRLVPKAGLVSISGADGNNSFIRKEDSAVWVSMVNGRVSDGYIHKSMLKSEGAVRIHSRKRGIEEWAAKDVAIIKTIHGRKVVEGHHEVLQLWDGTWDFRNSKLKHVRLQNTNFFYYGELPADLAPGGAIYDRIIVKPVREQIALDYATFAPLYPEHADRLWLYSLMRMHEVQFNSLARFERPGYGMEPIAAGMFPWVDMLNDCGATFEAFSQSVVDWIRGRLSNLGKSEVMALFKAAQEATAVAAPAAVEEVEPVQVADSANLNEATVQAQIDAGLQPPAPDYNYVVPQAQSYVTQE